MRKNIYLVIGILVVVVISFAAIDLFLLKMYSKHMQADNRRFNIPNSWMGGPKRHNEAPPAKDIESIKEWMTFNYLNHIFNLPNDYLKEQLNITNEKYPNITIARAITTQSIGTDDYLTNLKALIQAFLLDGRPR